MATRATHRRALRVLWLIAVLVAQVFVTLFVTMLRMAIGAAFFLGAVVAVSVAGLCFTERVDDSRLKSILFGLLFSGLALAAALICWLFWRHPKVEEDSASAPTTQPSHTCDQGSRTRRVV